MDKLWSLWQFVSKTKINELLLIISHSFPQKGCSNCQFLGGDLQNMQNVFQNMQKVTFGAFLFGGLEGNH